MNTNGPVLLKSFASEFLFCPESLQKHPGGRTNDYLSKSINSNKIIL